MFTRGNNYAIEHIEYDGQKGILDTLIEYNVISANLINKGTHIEFSDGAEQQYFLALDKYELDKLIDELLEIYNIMIKESK